MGRFLSPDWSAKEDPVPYANLDDPQSLNLYSYVRNNPLARTDPDGHCCEELIGIATDAIEDFALSHPGVVNAVAGPLVESAASSTTSSAGSSLLGSALGIGTGVVGGIVGAMINPATVSAGDLPVDANGHPIVPADSSAQEEHTSASEPQTSTSGAGARQGSGTKPPDDDQAGKGVQRGKKDRSQQGTVDQLKDITKNQQNLRKIGKGEAIRETKKSQQDVDNANKRIKSSKDVEE